MARLEDVLSGWKAVRWCEENPGKELVCAEPHTFGPARMRVARTVDGAPSLVQVRSGGSPEWKDARSAIWWPWEVVPDPVEPVMGREEAQSVCLPTSRQERIRRDYFRLLDVAEAAVKRCQHHPVGCDCLQCPSLRAAGFLREPRP